MRKMLVVITMALVSFGNVYASEKALNELNLTMGPQKLETPAIPNPPAPSKATLRDTEPYPLVPVTVIRRLDLPYTDVPGLAVQQLSELPGNLQKAGKVYLTGYISGGCPIAYYATKVMYSANSVPDDVETVSFLSSWLTSDIAQQKLNEMRDNLPKAGLVYMGGNIYCNSNNCSVKVTFSRVSDVPKSELSLPSRKFEQTDEKMNKWRCSHYTSHFACERNGCNWRYGSKWEYNHHTGEWGWVNEYRCE